MRIIEGFVERSQIKIDVKTCFIVLSEITLFASWFVKIERFIFFKAHFDTGALHLA